MYHKLCIINFRNGKKIPQQYISDSTKHLFGGTILGRPPKSVQLGAFDETFNYLEGQITLTDLHSKMAENHTPNNCLAYDKRWLMQKPLDRYEDRILISGAIGKSCLITLRESAASIDIFMRNLN